MSDQVLDNNPSMPLEKYLTICVRRSLDRRWGHPYMQGCFGDFGDFDPDGLMADDIRAALQTYELHARLTRHRANIAPVACVAEDQQ